MTGGQNSAIVASAELYDVETGRFSSAGNLTSARRQHTATLLGNGALLIAAGENVTTTFGRGELYALTPSYTITDLGTLGGTFSQAYVLGDNGLIGGLASIADGSQHAAIWYNGQIGDLATIGLGGPNSGVYGLNELGQVAGQAETSTPDPDGEDFCAFGTHLVCLPFLWQYGTMTPLPTLGGKSGAASNPNSRGEVVGFAETSVMDPTCIKPQKHGFQAVIWGPSRARSGNSHR